MYDRLFVVPNPGKVEEGKTYLDHLNPGSLTILKDCKLESGLKNASKGQQFQFERKGFFCADLDTSSTLPVFNLTVPLRDTWAKIEAK